MKYYYKIIGSIKELYRYKPEYNNILNSIQNQNSLFYELEYLEILMPLINTISREVFVLVFSENSKIVAIAPFEIKHRTKIFFKSKILRFIGTELGLLSSCYGGVIMLSSLASFEREKVFSLIKHAIHDSSFPEWNEYSFENLYHLSYFEELKNVFAKGKLTSSTKTYSVDVTKGIDSYFKNDLSKSLRSQLRRAKKKLELDYKNVEFACLTDLTSDNFLEMSKLHNNRQEKKDIKEQGIADILQRHFIFKHPLSKKVFKELTSWAESQSILRCFLLRVDGKLACFIYCIKHYKKLHAIVMAIDVEYSKITPAKLLTLFAIEYEYKRSEITHIDFLSDGNLFKKQMLKSKMERFTCRGKNYKGLKNAIMWSYSQCLRFLMQLKS